MLARATVVVEQGETDRTRTEAIENLSKELTHKNVGFSFIDLQPERGSILLGQDFALMHFPKSKKSTEDSDND